MLTEFTIFEQPAEFVLVGSLNPLHICKNALRTDKDCVYAVCWVCNAEMSTKQERSRERVRDTDREKEMCDHLNLELLTDERYLSDTYRNGCIGYGHKVPVQCSICSCYITNNTKNMKKVN